MLKFSFAKSRQTCLTQWLIPHDEDSPILVSLGGIQPPGMFVIHKKIFVIYILLFELIVNFKKTKLLHFIN